MPLGLRVQSLSLWYVHWRRVAELVGLAAIEHDVPEIRPRGSDAGYTQVVYSKALRSWLRRSSVDSAQDLLLHSQLAPGSLFYCWADFYCRGLVSLTLGDEIPLATTALIHRRMPTGHELEIVYRPARLAVASAFVNLSGRARLFALAVAKDVSQERVEADALAIGSPSRVDGLPGIDEWV